MKTVEERRHLRPGVHADARASRPGADRGDRRGRAAPNFINDIAAGKVELPTIPRVVQQLIAALQDPDVDARKISESLSQDPVLSAKVLRLANSSFFGGQRSMASIDAAVALIGIQALNRLIVACGVSSSLGESRASTCAPSGATRWSPRPPPTSSRRASAATPKRPMSAACCTATGHLILCQTYPEIANLCSPASRRCAAPSSPRSRPRSFGIDHPAVSALWVESLGFPQTVADTIRRAAQPPGSTDGAARPRLAQRMRAGIAVAQKDDAAAAVAALPPSVRARISGADGQPDAAFVKLYDALQETEPSF